MGQLDYALIGNCQISALLDTKGRYVWCCMPRFDSQAVFASLLHDESAGVWSCLPVAERYEAKQRYLLNTNVLLTEYHLENGERYDVIDFAPRFVYGDSYYRSAQLMRIVRRVRGNPRVRLVCTPRLDYGRIVPDATATSEAVIFSGPRDKLFLQTDVPHTYVLDQQPFEIGSDHYFVLSYGEPFHHPIKFTCEEYLERTTAYWRTWVKHCKIPFEYQEIVIRSALALKLHVFEDTGAIIAATTTSLPESADGNRTWDYRYCWLRDAYFVINVLNQLGHFEEMEKFIQFLHNIAVGESGFELQPVYGIGGERELHEKELPWLRGWNGLGPVRVGNAAYSQPQYDSYGEMVLAVTPLFFDSRLDRIERQRGFDNVVWLVEKAIASFDKPDAGIWEYRGQRQLNLFSRLMCWAAVDRGVKIAAKLGKSDQFRNWETIRDHMRDVIEKRGWSQTLGCYVEAIDGSFPDASNLLMSALNFHHPAHERFVSTVGKYEELLSENGHYFRYRNDDDFGRPVHAFTVCNFWMVDALCSIGRKTDARRIFERSIALCNHVGLLSEDVDPRTGDIWGNFPQTYGHVGIINSAFHLSKSWSDAF